MSIYRPPKKKRRHPKKYIKVYKIVIKKQYHEKCDVCNRKLKKAVHTENGIMGYRCYLTAIGIPPSKPTITFKDLPQEAFEGVGEEIIKLIKKTDKKIWAKMVSKERELEFPPRFRSDVHFRYYPAYQRKPGKWMEGFLLLGYEFMISKMMEIPYELVKRGMESKTVNDYYLEQAGIAQQNPLGTTIKKYK